jgi:uncharacterized protein YoxC
MVNVNIPGLTDALKRLDDTQASMVALVEGMGNIATLLTETNNLLRDQNEILRDIRGQS